MHVLSANLKASFSGYNRHDFPASGSGLEIAQDAADELNEMQFQQKVSIGGGGLKRTVSSLHSSFGAEAPAKVKAELCTHSDHKNNCMVEAKQVEMDFATLTNQPFQLTIQAPNGERSPNFQFLNYGKTERFSPAQEGCGHGNWTFEICTFGLDENQKRVTKKTEEKIYLDGVGSLFFTIDDNLQMKLSGQDFLRLPSASQCCSNKH